MSGGSYDYAYRKVDDFVDEMIDGSCAKRMAFKQLLTKVSEAMHAIEWVDSGDYGEGRETKAIDDVFTFLLPDTNTFIKSVAFNKIKEITNSIDNTIGEK